MFARQKPLPMKYIDTIHRSSVFHSPISLAIVLKIFVVCFFQIIKRFYYFASSKRLINIYEISLLYISIFTNAMRFTEYALVSVHLLIHLLNCKVLNAIRCMQMKHCVILNSWIMTLALSIAHGDGIIPSLWWPIQLHLSVHSAHKEVWEHSFQASPQDWMTQHNYLISFFWAQHHQFLDGDPCRTN